MVPCSVGLKARYQEAARPICQALLKQVHKACWWEARHHKWCIAHIKYVDTSELNCQNHKTARHLLIKDSGLTWRAFPIWKLWLVCLDSQVGNYTKESIWHIKWNQTNIICKGLSDCMNHWRDKITHYCPRLLFGVNIYSTACRSSRALTFKHKNTHHVSALLRTLWFMNKVEAITSRIQRAKHEILVLQKGKATKTANGHKLKCVVL